MGMFDGLAGYHVCDHLSDDPLAQMTEQQMDAWAREAAWRIHDAHLLDLRRERLATRRAERRAARRSIGRKGRR